MSDTFIEDVRQRANGHWQPIFQRLGIEARRKHSPCPSCGGTDRFRFDDRDGRGTYFCSHCGAGTGLDLVMKVRQCSAHKAAGLVADVMALPLPETAPARQKTKTDIVQKVAALVAQSSPGQSAYLTAKGLHCPFPLLADGSLLQVLKNGSGAVTGAQVIKPDGTKRLIAGTVKKGAFCAVNTVTDNPGTVMIAEGLATALSVLQIRPDALVVCAIDAGNLLPVAQVMRKQHPQANIIIAADNDIKPDAPNTGKDAAEKAAAAVSGQVALPQTEEKADWNDIHQRHDLTAATAAFNDSVYLPGESMKPQLQTIDGGKNTSRPSKDDLTPYFAVRYGSLYYVELERNRLTGGIDEKKHWIADEMETAGTGSDGKDGYLVIGMKPEGGDAVIYEAIPRREVGTPQGWGRLRSRGVNITAKRGHLDLLANHLQRSGRREQWTITHTAGWHNGAYVMPDGHIIGKPDRPVAFCGGTSAVAGYVVRGTADEWRDNVATLMWGNQSMVLGALVAFAAPLNSLAGGGSFGIHLFAPSSAGKTTTVEAASSIYGVPDELKLTWDATSYGLTVEAASRNDGFMPVDEIGQSNNAKHVAGSAYNLFNGTGRVQGSRDGGNKAILRWTIAALSTGEMDFETYLLGQGITPRAGQLVRLISVPFTDTTEFHGMDDGDQHSRAVKRASARYCGAVGRAWIEQLAVNAEAARRTVTEKENAWLLSLPESLSPQGKRVATRFALLDAAAALSASLTGWEPQACSQFIRASYQEWLENYGTGNREKFQVVSRARDFIQRHGLSRFQPYSYGKRNGDMDISGHASRISQLAGYLVSGRRDDGLNEYHIIPSVFEAEILCGIQKKTGAAALEEAGILIRPEGGRMDGKTISINGTQQRFVVLVDSDG